jgi:hypothetical protein
MALKGETKDPFCKDMKATTAFLGGTEDKIKKERESNDGCSGRCQPYFFAALIFAHRAR